MVVDIQRDIKDRHAITGSEETKEFERNENKLVHKESVKDEVL